MPHTAVLARRAVAAGVVLRWAAWLRRSWDQCEPGDDERGLGEARDLADLEARLRRRERGRAERFAPLAPPP